MAYRSRYNLTYEEQVILLMITDGEKWYYLMVKNLSGLLRGITSTHYGDFHCLNCFRSYRTTSKLELHKKICENHDYCQVEMPTKNNNIIKYNHGEKSMKLPFVIYADLECLLKKMSTCINNPNESSTTKINKHIPSGYSIFTRCSFDESKNKLNYYRGNDYMKNFCKDLRIHATKIINYEKKNYSINNGTKKNYNDQKVCYICKKKFDTINKKNYKVRDHCHYTSKYRRAALNLRYKVPKEIPVVFHNGSTYDYHFIIKELVKEFEGNFDCLGENTENYITFSVPLKKKIQNKNLEIAYKIKFIDSFRFMSSSLSKLVDNLSEGIHNNKCADCKSNLDYVRITKNKKLLLKCFNCNIYYKKKINNDLIKKFKNTYSFCNNDTSSLERINKFVLLLRKGVYPYEYMDTWERFSEISLPSKEDFYSNLNMEVISEIVYRRANNVFKRFKLENLGDYQDLYVQSDTLLLADVFNNFRDMCIKEYELDPAHFLSLPGLAWQACLKKTNIELELLTDYDMLLMVEEGIRGGICHSIHRCAKANNKYMKNYNINQESSYIQYLDANNLYGWAMSKKLPVNGFKWFDSNKINEEFIKNYYENDKKGYILEVDVKYPKELHDLHSDLPLLPKRMEINKCKKLVCNLYDKKKYVVHINSLKQALNHGLKLKKIHRIIEFNQKAWLKPYIDMNTELRKLARNDFEKDLFKLMNNSVFGKTMENIRKHRDIKLVTTDKKRSKLVSEPNYDAMNLISEDLSIIEMKKTKIKMNKPIYLGLSILEISKILMYEFWYDYMKPKYNDNVRLCYMNTDSFVMHIKTNDFYKDISHDVYNRFDTSNYGINGPLPIGKNKKVIGLMKNELGGEIIAEFIALKPKTYSYLVDNDKIDKKAKGTKKWAINQMIKFDDYKNCLLNDKILLKSQQRFISTKHDVYNENVNKIALSNDDDKKIVSSNKITSYPYGYTF